MDEPTDRGSVARAGSLESHQKYKIKSTACSLHGREGPLPDVVKKGFLSRPVNVGIRSEAQGSSGAGGVEVVGPLAGQVDELC